MEIINHQQKSQEWLDVRARCFTASEAPAAMGASKYTTRTELLRQKATGMAKEIDASTQRRFDAGNQAEEAARYIVEDLIGDDLSPLTGALEVDGLPLLASFDGITQGRDIVWETKLLNATLADAVRAGQLEAHYYWQLEQQLLVSGAERVYFTTSDGTPENTVGMWYTAVPGRREQLIAGWKQFAEDLANYQHVEIAERPAADVTIELPALFIHAKGEITDSNMQAYGAALAVRLAEVRAIELVTDQDFSNAKQSAAMLREQCAKMKLTKEAMLSQTVTIGEAARMMDAWSEDMRVTALKLEKDVERADAAKKAAILSVAKIAYVEYIKALNTRLGGQYMPVSVTNFADAIKGKRNYASMTDAVDAVLANAKVDADMMAERIELNRKSLFVPDLVKQDSAMVGMSYEHLFPDFAAVCTKAPDDFAALLGSRIAAEEKRLDDTKKAEADLIAAAVEAERKAGEARAAAAIEAERMAEAKRAAEAAQQVQRGKTEDATHAVQQATELPQAPAAITPPIQQSDMGQSLDGLAGKTARAPAESMAAHHDAALITEFLALQACSPADKKAMRATIEKWETYRVKVAEAMKAAA